MFIFGTNNKTIVSSILRNILVVSIAILLGGMLNMFIITISEGVFALPEGVNPKDMESIKAHIHLYKVKHFIFPFLAHAFGSLLAGFVAAKFAASHPIKLGLFAGGFFIVGGLMMAFMLPAPLWFEILDVFGAYFPMAYWGTKIAKNSNNLLEKTPLKKSDHLLESL